MNNKRQRGKVTKTYHKLVEIADTNISTKLFRQLLAGHDLVLTVQFMVYRLGKSARERDQA